ncbi:MAG: alanine racemase, partial [Clostridia bacterium]|nr:alanine racemase [Clostridia bacterium]
MLHSNLTINNAGHLMLGGVDVVELAVKYGTPLYVMDEQRIRENCRLYKKAMREHLPHGSKPLYASKALCYAGIFKVMKEEGMAVDIVSAGELYTALRAQFPAENMYFHGNSKPDSEIEYAINAGVGHFVVDSMEELEKIDMHAGRKRAIQKVLLRVTPNIDTHTHKKIATGTIDCKFGTPIETGQAEEFIKTILSKKNVRIDGLHCHVGSQIFDEQPFCQALEVMV